MDMPVDAFLTALYTIVDDWYQAEAPKLLAGKVGSKPEFSDSEVLTLSLAQHWLGFTSERCWLRFVRKNYLPLFPRLLHQSEFNRRARNLCFVLNAFGRWLTQQSGAHAAAYYLVDGTPIHVRHWRRYGPRSLMLPGAGLGFCAAKKETFYGYRLVVLVTLDGRLLDWVLLPGGADERDGLDELLEHYRGLKIFADKGFLDQDRQANWHERYGHCVWTPKRTNQRHQNPRAWDALSRRLRQRVETWNDQAKDFFGLERPGVKTFWGLRSRIIAKLTGLTLAGWLNAERGRPPLALAGFTI